MTTDLEAKTGIGIHRSLEIFHQLSYQFLDCGGARSGDKKQFIWRLHTFQTISCEYTIKGEFRDFRLITPDRSNIIMFVIIIFWG